MDTLLQILGLIALAIACFVGIASLLLGLPGTFVILVAAAVYAWATGFAAVSLATLGWLLVLAVVAEVLEFVAAARGGPTGATPTSRRIQISAIAGSIVGGILGAPILFGLGALLGALAGAFVGAALAASTEGESMSAAAAHGLAALRGRLLGFVLKASLAVVMVILIAIAVI